MVAMRGGEEASRNGEITRARTADRTRDESFLEGGRANDTRRSLSLSLIK